MGTLDTTLQDPLVTMRGVSKQYETLHQAETTLGALAGVFRRKRIIRHAVSDLDLDIFPGEIVGLLGPNGAGKTTTVKLLCGLLTPTSGSIRAFGETPSRRNFEFLRRISVIFGQKSMLWWDVSTLESLKIHKAIYEITTIDFKATVERLVDTLGIGHVINVPARSLSLGERMKCELALALLHSPRLLFADEPTIGLDVNAKVEVRKLFHAVNAEFGTTIVLTTHDMNDVEALVKRVVLVSEGTKQFDGQLDELRRNVATKQPLVLTYRHAPAIPVAYAELVSWRTAESIAISVDDAALGETIREATAWGTVADIKVEEASLDNVMIAAFRGREGTAP